MHASRDCVWPIILDTELHKTYLGEPVLVAIMCNVTFLPFKPCFQKIHTCFSKDAESLTIYGSVL